MQEGRVVVLTGGHAGSTAEATVAEIKKRKLNWKIYWIGREQIPGKIQTIFTKSTLPDLFKIPFGFISAFVMLIKIKPDLVLSFGGSSGSLVSFASFLLGTSVVIHEQTAVIGRGNKIVARFAKKIAISRESSRIFFPKDRVVFTGNPIDSRITRLGSVLPRAYVKTIFVTGGSQGSEKINKVLIKILPRLKRKYKIIHQAGEGHAHKYGAYAKVDMVDALVNADIVVARAGANTVSELIAAKKPCVLIPIPFSFMDEQTKNAEYAESLGIARVLPQSDLTPQRLEAEIENLIKDYPKIIAKIKNIVSPDLDASKKLVDLLEKEI